MARVHAPKPRPMKHTGVCVSDWMHKKTNCQEAWKASLVKSEFIPTSGHMFVNLLSHIHKLSTYQAPIMQQKLCFWTRKDNISSIIYKNILEVEANKRTDNWSVQRRTASLMLGVRRGLETF